MVVGSGTERLGLGFELGRETCGLGLATYGLGLELDDFRIRGLGFGLERGLERATMGLDYISEVHDSMNVLIMPCSGRRR